VDIWQTVRQRSNPDGTPACVNVFCMKTSHKTRNSVPVKILSLETRSECLSEYLTFCDGNKTELQTNGNLADMHVLCIQLFVHYQQNTIRIYKTCLVLLP